MFVASHFCAGVMFFALATILAFLRPFAVSPGDLSLILLIFIAYLTPITVFLSLAAFINKLWRYETETKKLEKRVTELVDRLAAKGIDSNALLKSIEDKQRAQ